MLPSRISLVFLGAVLGLSLSLSSDTSAQQGKKKKADAKPADKLILHVIRIAPGQTLEWETALQDRQMRPNTRDGATIVSLLKPGETETELEEAKRTISIFSKEAQKVNEDIAMAWNEKGLIIHAKDCAKPETVHDFKLNYSPFGQTFRFTTGLRFIIVAGK